MKIVVLGLAKSGTSVCFFKLKNSLPAETVCLFEPLSYDFRAVWKRSIASLKGLRAPDVLAKILPFRPRDPADPDSFSSFEKQILLVRDSRDRLISRLLYAVYHSDFYHRDDRLNMFLELLKQKESDPRSVSIKRLWKTFVELNGEVFTLDRWLEHYRKYSIQMPLDYHERRPKLFVFRYEDLVDQRVDGLEKYLGIRLTGESAVSPEFGRVMRTKSYGNWRDWFTAEDVDCLRPVLQPFQNRYYSKDEWELNPFPSIPAKYCSEYVERIVN